MEPLAFLLAGAIGLTLGLLGAGGSILTVPVFVYVLGFAAKPAIAMSLPVVGTTSLVGAIRYWRAGNVAPRTALVFGAIAMAGSFVGAKAAVFVSGAVQLTLLGVAVVTAAFAMLRDGGAASEPAGETAPLVPRSSIVIAAAGLGIGVLTGLVGIGGGFLIVPALVLLARIPIRQAVGTSLVVIAMNAASGAVGYAGEIDLPWGFVAGFSAVAIAGVLLGTHLVRFVSPGALRRAFALVLLALGALILYSNRAVLAPRLASTGPTSGTGAPPRSISPEEVFDAAQATL